MRVPEASDETLSAPADRVTENSKDSAWMADGLAAAENKCGDIVPSAPKKLAH